MKPTAIRRFRQVPPTARILVKTGEAVEPHTPVAHIDALPGRVLRVDAASAIGVDGTDLAQWMLRRVGDHVSPGEAIAARTDFFDRQAAKSPTDGILSIVSRSLGHVYVRELFELGKVAGPATVDVAKELKIRPSEEGRIQLSPGVKRGSIVLQNQILAMIDRGPLEHHVVKSPIYGRVRDVSPDHSTISISPVFASPDILAYVRGMVTDVVEGQGVEVTGRATVIEGVWGMGGEGFGRLSVTEGNLEDSVAPDGVIQGSVLAVEGTASYGALISAYQVGVSGVILGYLSSSTILRLVGANKNLGITGDEDVPFPIVVTEGFLRTSMRATTFAALRRSEGSVVSIRGVTHIRAGVIRPEVLIPCHCSSIR